jgi:hypothetical protein
VSAIAGVTPPAPSALDEPREAEALPLGWGVLGPVLVAALIVAGLAYAIVACTPSAWQLLGAGRTLVPEEHYASVALLVLLGTTLGQFVGWAAGSGLAAHLFSLVARRPVTAAVLRTAMVVVYLGLAVVPLATYHFLFGQPLLGLEREGLEAWLAATHPDAHLLLYRAHPVVLFSILPLAVAVVGLLWRAGDRRLGHRGFQFLLALLVLATSLAVALSLAIHSILVHVRF